MRKSKNVFSSMREASLPGVEDAADRIHQRLCDERFYIFLKTTQENVVRFKIQDMTARQEYSYALQTNSGAGLFISAMVLQ